MKKKFPGIYILLFIAVSIIFLTGCSNAKYTFIYHANNEQIYEAVTKETSELDSYVLPQPNKEGYTFDGWFFDSEFKNEFSKEKLVEGNNELYAKWSINEYKITVHDGEENIEYKFNYNEVIKLNDLTKDDYAFNGYYIDEGLTNKFELVNMPATNIDLYPKFTEIHRHNYVIKHGYQPTFEEEGLSDGLFCDICGEIFMNQEVIPKLKYEDYAYIVQLQPDDHVTIKVYDSQNYDEAPTISSIAYSRNGDNGELDKTGNGQLNIQLIFDEAYALDEIKINGKYKNLKEISSSTSGIIYRITKISSNLDVIITSKNIAGSKMISDFSSNIDDSGLLSISWGKIVDYNHIDLNINKNGEENKIKLENDISAYTLQLEENKSYILTFTPFYNDTVTGEIITMHYAYSPTARNIGIERVEILTKDNILPTTDYVASPTGWGAGLTNNNYVSAILNIYNAANELVFTSESIANETDAYSGGKIKIRGNTSAYGIKKPYKIKLSSEIDLLGLLNSRNISDNRSNKEWLLLAQGEYTNYFVGREVSNLIDSDNYLDYKYISLFLNGDFKGIYILSDSINDKTCNVSNTGYLVENDAYWWNEDVYFETTISSMYKQLGYTFKYPDTDELSNEQIEYIKNYISNYESLLMNRDVNVSNYIDMNSFSKWLLIHDILVTNDAGGSNMYLKKNDNSDSKMMSGPAWDFDSIFKGTNYLAPIRSDDFYIFKYLLEYNEFEEQYKANYNLIRNNLITQLDSRWANIFSPELDNLHQLYLECYNTYYLSLNEQYTYAINFITEHLSYMDTVI